LIIPQIEYFLLGGLKYGRVVLYYIFYLGKCSMKNSSLISFFGVFSMKIPSYSVIHSKNSLLLRPSSSDEN